MQGKSLTFQRLIISLKKIDVHMEKILGSMEVQKHTVLTLICTYHTMNLKLKARVKKEVSYDDTMQQSQYEVKVRNIYLKVITLQALLEAGEKQFSNWKGVNSKNKGSSWRKPISEGIMRKVN